MIQMKIFNKAIMCLIFSVFLAAGMISSASALSITPTTNVLDQSRWEWEIGDEQNPDAGDVATITGSGPLSELYKQDVGGPESGDFASSYTTSFSNTETDPQDALIVHDGGPSVTGPPLFLLVKDGDQDPRWYIFDLLKDELDWNGTDDLELTGFWPNQGSISHVSIYGSEGQVPIPEPNTVVLVSLGLFGLAALGRKRFLER
jgi:hypothetical protein